MIVVGARLFELRRVLLTPVEIAGGKFLGVCPNLVRHGILIFPGNRITRCYRHGRRTELHSRYVYPDRIWFVLLLRCGRRADAIKEMFVNDFVAAWAKVMTFDRFDAVEPQRGETIANR